MTRSDYIKSIFAFEDINIINLDFLYPDELYITVSPFDFTKSCNLLHKHLGLAVATFFAEDLRTGSNVFRLYCGFLSIQIHAWVFVCQDVASGNPKFASIAKDIYSASLFEREIKEMFGIEPVGNPDLRSLKLHDEVWPKGYYPLLKDFFRPQENSGTGSRYQFKRVEGEGIFEVPVGPVHAGVIGPGHFRFSVAGEPIINLEIRLGWTHRGIEKLLEGKSIDEAVSIFERISGDTAFGYSMAFCRSVE
ncbi:MAG: NADH-quinone oxidoreductase subunit C, partial [Candidatus Omnitrophica bacterium]|nr:NADH-quinone oxidoreductase subunit C [Candidatus Omnitrophota bacterium]